MYGYKSDSEDEQMMDHTVPATDSSPEPPPEPVRRRMRMRTGRTRPASEEVRTRDEPVDATGESNIQVLRVGHG